MSEKSNDIILEALDLYYAHTKDDPFLEDNDRKQLLKDIEQARSEVEEQCVF